MLTWGEQIVLFNEFPPHLRKMAEFANNTGCRKGEVTFLKWEWLYTDPETGIH